MPLGTCDPASRGDEWNTVEYAVDDGNVVVTIRWDWDRVSVRPDCDGPVIDIRVRNSSQLMYYANLPAKKRGARNVEIPPGTDVTISSKGQLRNLGLENYADTIGVQPHTEPLNLQG